MSEPQPTDESLERENYEIVNAMDHCQNCGALMADQSISGYHRTVCPVCGAVEREQYEL